MIIYFVYQITSITPYLYGYAKSKKVINKFKKERDMKKFKIVEKDMDESEVQSFESHNRYYYIDIRKYITYIKNEYGYTKDYVEIASTLYEEERTYVLSDAAAYEAGKFTKYPVSMFNKDLQKALCILNYDIIQSYTNSDIHNYIYPDVLIGKKLTENISVDTFYVFMYKYGNTMKGL